MLSKKLIEILLNSEKVTKNNKILQINLALNYGSKNELINAINLIKKKKINFSEFNKILISFFERIFLLPIILNFIPFLFNWLVFFVKKSLSKLNKKLTSFLGLFQFSVENA